MIITRLAASSNSYGQMEAKFCTTIVLLLLLLLYIK